MLVIKRAAAQTGRQAAQTGSRQRCLTLGTSTSSGQTFEVPSHVSGKSQVPLAARHTVSWCGGRGGEGSPSLLSAVRKERGSGSERSWICSVAPYAYYGRLLQYLTHPAAVVPYAEGIRGFSLPLLKGQRRH